MTQLYQTKLLLAHLPISSGIIEIAPFLMDGLLLIGTILAEAEIHD
jgi:hypothetical protein